LVAVRIAEAASRRLDDIYRYTRNRWGDEQAGAAEMPHSCTMRFHHPVGSRERE
jgi:plasmid stabilization system protein ParE